MIQASEDQLLRGYVEYEDWEQLVLHHDAGFRGREGGEVGRVGEDDGEGD